MENELNDLSLYVNGTIRFVETVPIFFIIHHPIFADDTFQEEETVVTYVASNKTDSTRRDEDERPVNDKKTEPSCTEADKW